MRRQGSLGSIDSFALTQPVLWLVLVLVLVSPLAASGEVKGSLTLQKGVETGLDQPIEITARRLSMKFGKGSAQATYEGNVQVKQGDVTMGCDRLVIDYEMKEAKSGQGKLDPQLAKDVSLSNLRTITATENVKIVQGNRMATAGKAVFDNKKRTIELTENPSLWMGPDRLSGKKIVFFIDENRSEVDSEVNTVISPGKPGKEQDKNLLHLQKGAAGGAEQPIEITARRLSMKFGKGSAQATYEGNVKVRQGDVTMSCDRLVIDYEMKEAKPGQNQRSLQPTKDVTLSNLKTITAMGNVKIVQGDRMATAGKAVFDNKRRTIELTDGPQLWMGPDRLSGNKIVYYIDENRSEVDSEVNTVISPGKPSKDEGK